MHSTKKFAKRCIINLQETHLTDENNLKYQWKWGSVQSPGSSNSCGVAILYNVKYLLKLVFFESHIRVYMIEFCIDT